MNRRELLLVGAGALAAKATASTLACAKDGPPEGGDAGGKADPKKPAGDEHAGHAGHAGHAAPAGSGVNALVDTSSACLSAGNICLAHCLRLLSDGDKSMAACGSAVAEMLPVCEMMGRLAATGSKHLATAAKLCHDVCSSCAAACKPHSGHHAECKACFEACEASVAEAKKHMA